MELFTISVMTAQGGATRNLYELMTRALDELTPQLDHEIYWSFQENEMSTTIHCSLIHAEKYAIYADSIYRNTGNVLAQFIMEEFEISLIRRMIVSYYGDDPSEDLQALETYCLQLLNVSSDQLKRTSLIAVELSEYLLESAKLNVNGFLRFRLHRYMAELKELIEYAVDEFIMDKQYHEFISLLKYFVYIQETKIPVAHLMHVGDNQFIILNELMRPIHAQQSNHLVLEMIDKEINYEDMIVSTLITISPQQIYVHTHDTDIQVVKTILQIFEGRVQICTRCKDCTSIMDNGQIFAHHGVHLDK